MGTYYEVAAGSKGQNPSPKFLSFPWQSFRGIYPPLGHFQENWIWEISKSEPKLAPPLYLDTVTLVDWNQNNRLDFLLLINTQNINE